ncbi:hypothetical protein K438DRAFT_1771054 [Mycena galopus ATCC 62051]|nr:hypothetical protein K438DRAFT_1771054 [Mycena galopus ATCC 62051]
MPTASKDSPCPSKENDSTTPSQARRKHRSSSRREPLRGQNRRGNTPNDAQPEDETTARIRELEEKIRLAETKLQHTEARLRDAQAPAQSAPQYEKTDVISRPKRVSDVTMEQIRDQLGFEKSKWNDLRSCARDCLSAARLDTKLHWKAQDTSKLAMAYNAIEHDFPALRRFEGKWAVARIAKDIWDNRKSYKSCMRKPSTYVGRRAAARREARGTSVHRSSSSSHGLSPPPPSGTRAGTGSPTPGPSQPRKRPRPRPIPRSSSSDDTSDDLLEFSDHEHPHDVDEEQEEDSVRKGKKRTKQGGGSPSKRTRH